MHPRHAQGLLLFIALACGVSLTNRYLTHHFDAVSQNFFRFSAGAVLLLSLSLWRVDHLRSLLRQPGDAALSAVCGGLIAGTMYLGTLGLSGISAATASVLVVAGTPTTIGLSMLLFADERCRRPGTFALGMLGLLGATAAYSFAATGEGGGGVDQAWGIGLFAASMILRSVLSLLLKDVLRRQDSQAVASLNATVCAVVLALWAGLSGGPMAPQAAGWPVAVLLVVSGVVGIWAGVALNNWLVSGLGLVRMQLSTCAVPPVVAVVGWLILGEAVGLGQLACGGLILGCVVYLMWLKHESASASAEVSEPVVFDQPKAAIGHVVKDHADSRATCSHH